LEATPDVPEAMFGDGLRLRQILTNLVGNAVKFTASGYIQIAIITSHENDKDFIDITVTDTGIGIASGRRIAIFDEFVQADEGTGRKYGGTGLGLAISRKLAELMGGVLTLDAPTGPGSTFRLRLPLRVAQKIDQADILRGAPNAVAAAPGEPTILVVEDHDINRELVTSLLQRLGYKFDVAGNGREAVLAVAKAAESGRRFDAVLMDIQMPEMDGLEATRRIRAMNISSTDLPIIALTANAYAEDIEECIAAGMQAHVAKPLRIDELRQVLDHYICSQSVAVRPSSLTGAGKIEALRKRYDVFKRECLESLQQFDNGQEKGAEVQALMHKLVGTAALFNDAELGSAAHKMETAITSNEDIEQTCAMVIKLLT
jgi:CheY-like chemotaxis protein/HPt (histidine-containing phosphotransfer) domain-containing protein